MEFKGKTVEEAITLGLTELGLTIDDVEINVVKEAVKGLFGRVKEEAVVEIAKKQTGLEKASAFLEKVLDIMSINAKINISKDKDNDVLTLITDKSSTVIGYRGEVLDALQTLAGAVANIGNEDYKKVVVDCEKYRTKREDTLISLAHKLEAKAVELRRDVWLEPMSPFERRIIHTALAESQVATTKSEGKEPNRFVVIVPNEKDEFSTPYNAGRNSSEKRDRKQNYKSDRRNGGKNMKNRSKSNSGSSSAKKSITFGTYLGNSLK